MRVVIDLSPGQGGGEGVGCGRGAKLFVNPVGRTAYFYDENTRKKVPRRAAAALSPLRVLACPLHALAL